MREKRMEAMFSYIEVNCWDEKERETKYKQIISTIIMGI